MHDTPGMNPPEKGEWRPVWLLAAAAVLLRLLLLLGRGDYLAFDEGFYLLLARSLYIGDGYSLIGLPHVTLSPLFPILAGAAGWLLDSWVWGGRVVAAVAAGLLVVPAWAIYRRLAPPRTALIAAALVVVLPSLAPFVVPFWIGADLWVGAEPLLHLSLYGAIALWLRADEHEGLGWWAGAAALFALAFLARPEAIITWGLLGLAALFIAARRRSLRRLAGAAIMGLAFLAVAAPYWSYIHVTTGEWALTGRGITASGSASRFTGGGSRAGAAGTIERMLWQDDASYETYLYSLDPEGLRLRADYWGVYPERAPDRGTMESGAPARESADTAAARTAAPGATASSQDDLSSPSPFSLFVRSMGRILPLLLWPFVILGAAAPRPRGVLRRELPVTLSLIGTSLAIAALVAVDPRTQLFLVPLLAFYAARGFAMIDEIVSRQGEEAALRPGFLEALLAGVAVLWMLGINGERLYVSMAYGSPHHVVAEQNRAVAEELDELLEGQPGPVASWHPAIAVYADRDWRVLPFANIPSIVRYEQAAGATAIVLSAYYPPDVGVENLDTRYLILRLPETPQGDPVLSDWRINLVQSDSIRAFGQLSPAP